MIARNINQSQKRHDHSGVRFSGGHRARRNGRGGKENPYRRQCREAGEFDARLRQEALGLIPVILDVVVAEYCFATIGAVLGVVFWRSFVALVGQRSPAGSHRRSC